MVTTKNLKISYANRCGGPLWFNFSYRQSLRRQELSPNLDTILSSFNKLYPVEYRRNSIVPVFNYQLGHFTTTVIENWMDGVEHAGVAFRQTGSPVAVNVAVPAALAS